jgi:putative ABC transport system permease protein
VLVGETLARKYGWKTGDKISLQTDQPQKNGSTDWTFDVVGTFRFTDPNMKVWEDVLLANWDYVNEARASDVGTVLIYAAKVSKISDLDRVGRSIEALTANSDHETRVANDNEMNKAIFRRYGDMGIIVTSIMGAVFFTLLLLTAHTMARAVHDRIPELAVLKTLGFTDGDILGLVLCESVALVLVGGIIGLCIAASAVGAVRAAHVIPIPILSMSIEIWVRGLILATTIGLCVGALPAVWGMRLQIADALSRR